MAIPIKTPGEIAAMRSSGRLAWRVVQEVVAGKGERAESLAVLARAALDAALACAGPGARWSQVVAAATSPLGGSGRVLLSGYCGHGIGREMHEPPRLCFGAVHGPDDLRLEPGMVVTLEPIVLEAAGGVVTLDDGWTVLTDNRAWAA